jgi:aldehyde:ferredoxin oxidoreductase
MEKYAGGYTGKILRVNLTDKTSKEEKLPAEVARDFIGGQGLVSSFFMMK